jgi:hypothetical protein
MALRPQGAVIPQQRETPRAVVVSRPPGATAKPLPDVAKAKEEISKKIRDMKEQGVPQEEIDKFTRQAKAKIEYLQMEKARESEEKRKQMERMSVHEGKKAGQS